MAGACGPVVVAPAAAQRAAPLAEIPEGRKFSPGTDARRVPMRGWRSYVRESRDGRRRYLRDRSVSTCGRVLRHRSPTGVEGKRAGTPAAQTAASPRLYTCADDRVDRCTSSVPDAAFASSCSVSQTATDPFPLGTASPQDTTATCTIELADVGADTARLVNTCSYPSQVPNSNPTDCVLFPRDGFIVIDPEPPPDDPSPNVPFTLDADPVPVFTARRAPSPATRSR
jgi:hypothetical protein